MFKYFNKNVWDIKRVLYIWRIIKPYQQMIPRERELEIEVERLKALLAVEKKWTAALEDYNKRLKEIIQGA